VVTIMSKSSSGTALRQATPGSVVARFLLFGALWWSLTEGDLYNWWFGVLMAVLATLASSALLPPGRWRPLGLIRFVPFFVRQSVLGGVDVARRAFSPEMPFDPGFVEFPLRLPDGPSRVFLANTMSLLPGTVSVELRDGSLRLHALDRSMPIERTLRTGEAHIAAIFGVELQGSGDTASAVTPPRSS
jgi:multicomponent Na+:H+ antiporter subunit E